MQILRSLSLACAGVAMLSARPAAAQDTRDVRIRLHKAGDTVSVRNAPVVIDHTIDAGRTDSAGTVLVKDLPDGGHIIEANAVGYLAMFDNFDSGPDVRQPVEIEMVADARPLEAAKVKGQMTDLRFADFDRRRLRGGGTFFTRAQLDAASGRPLANLLSIDAKASLVSANGGESLVALGAPPNAATPCYAAVVRDGMRIYPFTGASPPALDKIFPEQLAAIEFYPRPSQVPAELRDAATCGALVLWSRDRAR